jgi:hypothetical protein
MVGNIHKGHNRAFKAKVDLEAVKGEKILVQLSCGLGSMPIKLGNSVRSSLKNSRDTFLIDVKKAR